MADAEPHIGSGTSSRNSEVIHAGLYYPTGSLRERHCARSRRMLYEFCASHGVPHRKLGKLVVVGRDADIPMLEKLFAQATQNGVEGLRMLDGAEAIRMEPELACVAAFHSPETGIIDSHRYMLALQGDMENAGGVLALNTPVERLTLAPAGWEVRFGGREPGSLTVDAIVNAAGHGAQQLARATEGYPADRVPRLVLAKGNYFSYTGRPVFNRLVYPAPVPGGLGIHVTLDLAGRMRFGPDVQWIDDYDYNVDFGPCRDVLPGYSDLLARSSGWHACPRLRRHPPQADRPGRARRRFHDRCAGRTRPASHRASVRYRVAGLDGLAVDCPGSGCEAD